MTNAWPDYELERMKSLWAGGTSVAATARALNKTVGQVAGKLNRMGLFGVARTTSPGVKAVTIARVRKARPPKAVKQDGLNLMAPTFNVMIRGEAPEVVADKRVEAVSLGRSLVARVTSGAGVHSPNARPFAQGVGCNWPIGESPNVLACCNPIAHRTYCKGHALVAFTRPKAMTPTAVENMAVNLTRHERDDTVMMPGQRLYVPQAKSGWDSARAAA